MQPYNGHIYTQHSTVKLGNISDRNGAVLATPPWTGPGCTATASPPGGPCSTPWGTPTGTSPPAWSTPCGGSSPATTSITGFNDTIFNRMGSDITLTVDQYASAAAYDALGGKNGAVLVYDYTDRGHPGEGERPHLRPGLHPRGPGDQRGLQAACTWTTPCPPPTPRGASSRSSPPPRPWRSGRTPGPASGPTPAPAARTWAGRTSPALNGTAHGEQDIFAAMGNSCNVWFAQPGGARSGRRPCRPRPRRWALAGLLPAGRLCPRRKARSTSPPPT